MNIPSFQKGFVGEFRADEAAHLIANGWALPEAEAPKFTHVIARTTTRMTGLVFQRGDSILVDEAEAADLLKRGVAVRPGEPLDPRPPDDRPTQIRVLEGFKEVVQGAWAAVQFGRGEVVTVSASRAEALVREKRATFDLTEPQPVLAPAKSSRVRDILRRRTTQFLESFR
jgi:hypothetical protein